MWCIRKERETGDHGVFYLFVVGYWIDNGTTWVPYEDFVDRAKAEQQCHYLNGGN